MIYVLFGPPGVGKTYIGELLSRELGLRFFDADVLFDQKFRGLLKSGKFTQADRDKYFMKLIKTTKDLLRDGKDLIVAQAFIKEKNRVEYSNSFNNLTKYFLVRASRSLAEQRFRERILTKPTHVVDANVFEFAWKEFEKPQFSYNIIDNVKLEDKELVIKFRRLIK